MLKLCIKKMLGNPHRNNSYPDVNETRTHSFQFSIFSANFNEQDMLVSDNWDENVKWK